jgi:hypothetical protein
MLPRLPPIIGLAVVVAALDAGGAIVEGVPGMAAGATDGIIGAFTVGIAAGTLIVDATWPPRCLRVPLRPLRDARRDALRDARLRRPPIIGGLLAFAAGMPGIVIVDVLAFAPGIVVVLLLEVLLEVLLLEPEFIIFNYKKLTTEGSDIFSLGIFPAWMARMRSAIRATL